MTRPRPTRQGFTLVEMAVVLVLMGLLAALFVALGANSTGAGATLAAQNAASTGADAVVSAYTQAHDSAAPACSGATTTGTVTNTLAYANPCTLTQVSGDVRFVGAQSPSLGASVVSVGSQAGATGTTVALTVAQDPAQGRPVSVCHTLTRDMPAGGEHYYTFAPPVTGCTTTAAFDAVTAGAGACPSGTALSWRSECSLGTPAQP